MSPCLVTHEKGHKGVCVCTGVCERASGPAWSVQGTAAFLHGGRACSPSADATAKANAPQSAAEHACGV